MCLDCGCEEMNAKHFHDHQHGGHTHTHDGHTHDHEGHTHSHDHDGHTHSHDHDGHTHTHDHDHDHPHDHSHESRTISVEEKVLAKNDAVADETRQWLAERGICAINLISSPGTGKTLLLEKTLEALQGQVNCAVIVGDQQTDNDAKRLEGKGAKVLQIETYSSCHLNAEQVRDALPQVVSDDTQLLFIENVGNLVCPTAFDLGESFKVALLSTTEGEDKAAKYPVLFSEAQVVLLTKMDLVPYLDWDLAACRQQIRKVHPGIFIFEISAKTGDGVEEWISYLKNLVS